MDLTRQTLDYIAGLIRRRNAIQFPAGREYLVKFQLIPLVRRVGFNSATAVDKRIQTAIATRKPGDLQGIAEVLTINGASFFHGVTPFKGLTESVIPQLQQSRHSNILV